MPWASAIVDYNCESENPDMSRSELFYKLDVIRLMDSETCKTFEDGDPSVFSYSALISTFGVWILIYLCVFKGVKSSSFIVWVTVPVPVFFVFVMIVNNA